MSLSLLIEYDSTINPARLADMLVVWIEYTGYVNKIIRLML